MYLTHFKTPPPLDLQSTLNTKPIFNTRPTFNVILSILHTQSEVL